MTDDEARRVNAIEVRRRMMGRMDGVCVVNVLKSPCTVVALIHSHCYLPGYNPCHPAAGCADVRYASRRIRQTRSAAPRSVCAQVPAAIGGTA